MSLIEILTICIVILIASLAFVLFKLYKFSMILINLEDTIEECLDELDERYNSISEILDMPIFFDSVEIRRVVNDIRVSRESLITVANKLTETYGRQIESEEESLQDTKEI